MCLRYMRNSYVKFDVSRPNGLAVSQSASFLFYILFNTTEESRSTHQLRNERISDYVVAFGYHNDKLNCILSQME